jgi:hypothetical protein
VLNTEAHIDAVLNPTLVLRIRHSDSVILAARRAGGKSRRRRVACMRIALAIASVRSHVRGSVRTHWK